MRVATLMCALVLLMSAAMVEARPRTYEIDKVHSHITFLVDHLGFSRSMGRFNAYEIDLRFDSRDWSKSRVVVDIDIASLDMHDETWEKSLFKSGYFDLEQHPRARFTSMSVERIDDHNGRIHGELTLLGVTRPVILDFRFNREGLHKFSLKRVAGFSASTRIKRSDWGMLKHLGDVGDEVEIRIELEAIRVKK